MNEFAFTVQMHITLWDLVQAVGSIAALVSIELAGRGNVKARFWAWGLVIGAHLVILSAGIMLGLEGLYILNMGMIAAGIRNIFRDRKNLQEVNRLTENLKNPSHITIYKGDSA